MLTLRQLCREIKWLEFWNLGTERNIRVKKKKNRFLIRLIINSQYGRSLVVNILPSRQVKENDEKSIRHNAIQIKDYKRADIF